MSMSNSNLLSALEEARQNGYIHDFLQNEEGSFITLQEEITQFKVIEIIPCMACGATLYLLTDMERTGTYVHHWEI